MSAPVLIQRDQASDPEPEFPIEAETSEQAYEDWVSDKFDWGKRRDLLAYRWCLAWNALVAEGYWVDCGKPPEGASDP